MVSRYVLTLLIKFSLDNSILFIDTKDCITIILLYALPPPTCLNKTDKPTIADAQNNIQLWK